MDSEKLRSPTATGDDEVLTAAEVAAWLQLSVEAVRRLHRRGRLVAIDGSGRLRYSRGAVRRFINA